LLARQFRDRALQLRRLIGAAGEFLDSLQIEDATIVGRLRR
jgi:hypothetical protein